MFSQGRLFLSRHRLKDVLDDSSRNGVGDYRTRSADTNHLTGDVDSARSHLTGPARSDLTRPHMTADITATTIATDQSMLLSVMSHRLDQLQSTILTRLDHIDTTNNYALNSVSADSANSQMTAVAAQQTVILQRLDRIESTVQTQHELLVRLEQIVSRFANR